MFLTVAVPNTFNSTGHGEEMDPLPRKVVYMYRLLYTIPYFSLMFPIQAML